MCFRPAAVSVDKTCPECGEACPPDAATCPKCGAAPRATPTPAALVPPAPPRAALVQNPRAKWPK